MAKAYIASEINSKQVYKGNKSLGRRALERLKLRHQLDSMLAEVREQMVYNTPPELGDLWHKFESMWMQIVAEQDEALANEMRKAQITQWQRRKMMEELRAKAAWVGAVLLIAAWYSGLLFFLRTSVTYRGFL